MPSRASRRLPERTLVSTSATWDPSPRSRTFVSGGRCRLALPRERRYVIESQRGGEAFDERRLADQDLVLDLVASGRGTVELDVYVSPLEFHDQALHQTSGGNRQSRHLRHVAGEEPIHPHVGQVNRLGLVGLLNGDWSELSLG